MMKRETESLSPTNMMEQCLVISLEEGKVIKTIKVGDYPEGIAATPFRENLFMLPTGLMEL